MNYDADPLLDDHSACPKCSHETHHIDFCDHDDPDTGPLCRDICCPRWHETLENAA